MGGTDLINKNESFDIASLSLCEPGKKRCGDACSHQWVDDGSLLIACVADGVSRSICDWLASQLTVETFMSGFVSNQNKNIAERLVESAHEANNRLIEEGRIKGGALLSTLIAVAWDITRAKAFGVIVGDSRLYKLSADGLTQVGTDQKQIVAMRGPDGKLLSSGGAIALGSGITNAIGSHSFFTQADEIDLHGVYGFVLATDGFHENEAFVNGNVSQVWQKIDGQEALNSLGPMIRDCQKDDATVICVRNNAVTDEVRIRVIAALNESRPVEKDVWPYAVLRVLAFELGKATEDCDVETVRKCLDYAQKYGCNFGRQLLSSLANRAGALGNKAMLDMLVAAIRAGR
jgi:serine/threonine protein phosphatase PrpC